MLKPLKFRERGYAEFCVEIRERLVEKENLRLANDRTPHRELGPVVVPRIMPAGTVEKLFQSE